MLKTRLWRFNYVILALAVVVLLGGLAGCNEEKKTEEAKEAKPAAAPVKAEGLEFGTIEQVTGKLHMLMPLQKSMGEDVSVQNYLYINPVDGAMRWVFPHHRSRILDFSELTVKDEVVALMYRVVVRDTNGDGQMTGADGLTIALTSPDGNGYAEVLNDLEKLMGYAVAGDGVLVVVYQKGGSSYMARISLKDFTLTGETPLPKV